MDFDRLDELQANARQGMSDRIIFRARRIHTMVPGAPFSDAVAVADGKIVAVGRYGDVKRAYPWIVEDGFADAILLPGFVEAHAHLRTGGIWRHVYVGFYDRRAPDGRLWPGLKSFEEVVERLRSAEPTLPNNEPVTAWGFDPIFFGRERMNIGHLDRVSQSRPVVVMHQSFHAINVNSVMLTMAGIDSDGGDRTVEIDKHGRPTGELHEFATMSYAMRAARVDFYSNLSTEFGLRDYARIANLNGATTISDLMNRSIEETAPTFNEVTREADFPARLFCAMAGWPGEATTLINKLRRTAALNSDKLRYGAIKFIIDGTLQGFTARLRPPGFYNGRPNGIWNLTPDEFLRQAHAFHQAGFQLHIHTNGDEATELAIETFSRLLAEDPRPDHRHVLQHCQLADEDQFRRMKDLGLCVNIFANHIHYYGDIHYAVTVGPERAERMNATGTAHRTGIPYSIHSDSPVTPFAPLFTAWIAVN